LLVRLIECDSWTLLFWRGLLMTASFSLFLMWRRTSPFNLSGKGWLASFFLAVSTVCFVFSIQQTHAANTLVIIATSPLLAALLSWVFLKERVPPVTLAAILVGMGGVVLSLQDGFGRGSLKGEAFALGSALAMACYFTTLRWWRSEYGPLAVWGAGLIIALVALPQAQPFRVASQDVGWLLLLGAVALPLAFGMMAVGPRYLPAAEVNLLLLGETVLGPLWVWLALHEQPGPATLGGGFLVVFTLVAHSLYRREKGRRDAVA
jgi:drug/metabolite transporter (DMT)-like permease